MLEHRYSFAKLLLLLGILLLDTLPLSAVEYNKREFRGAWIQCVNGQFLGMSTSQIQNMLSSQLDILQRDGVNAIIFQVRPECDALYASDYEPWSRFLTGRQGTAPTPYWDPLQWMVEQCHKRGMEIHAWINPYRAKTKGTTELASNHIARKQPNRCFSYDGQYILNPGIPENRDYICMIAADIVSRYDIDGFHIDDYFYPYPVAGISIPDDREFKSYNNGFRDKGDWRRDNVNVFIKQLYETIHKVKPWVKFGVSPFGIYRNNKNGVSIGSNTNGLQNYDDLYADVLMWVNNGWVDYCVPQIYWEIGNKAADYETLIIWWDRHAGNRNLYIGEDVERTAKFADLYNPNINQMPAKYRLHSETNNVSGTVLWYAKAVTDNTGNYGSMLEKVYWKYPALMPLMPYIDKKAPKPVKSLKILNMDGKHLLFWKAPKGNGWKNKAEKYVVYRFEKGDKLNLSDPTKILAITSDTFYDITKPKTTSRSNKYAKKYYFAVTALDRM
ncbi:MAG: family 10 glycosylhydrolase, partial [Prevotella sp.]|nr:family 10 glycosylhydrolase [Prevotella sp.]